jgi:hypothetical protein
MIISFTGFIDTIFDDYQLSIIASYIIARLASLAREVFPDDSCVHRLAALVSTFTLVPQVAG